MRDEAIGKSFKSGNSVAIRIPAALAVEPGREWSIHYNERGDLVLTPRPSPGEKLDLSDVYGCVSKVERLPFDERELDWDGKLPKRG